MSDGKLTHLDESGEAHMVDVGEKEETEREAIARATLYVRPQTLDAIEAGGVPKGDVFAVARVAGIMAAKRTSDIIPLCHPLALTHAGVKLQGVRDSTGARIEITTMVRNRGKTGVEMEALTAASAAALTVYDMCKAIDREMVLGELFLAEKRGGRSGNFVHPKLSG